jgi:hypothetical protein
MVCMSYTDLSKEICSPSDPKTTLLVQHQGLHLCTYGIFGFWLTGSWDIVNSLNCSRRSGTTPHKCDMNDLSSQPWTINNNNITIIPILNVNPGLSVHGNLLNSLYCKMYLFNIFAKAAKNNNDERICPIFG